MCIALAAPWKMIVLASSMFLAKQSGSMPTPFAIDVMAPTDEHNGKGAIWHMPVKSPNPPMADDDRSIGAGRRAAARGYESGDPGEQRSAGGAIRCGRSVWLDGKRKK